MKPWMRLVAKDCAGECEKYILQEIAAHAPPVEEMIDMLKRGTHTVASVIALYDSWLAKQDSER